MVDLKNFLISAGFGKNETEVYSALLKKGASSVVELSKYTSIHRPNIYEALKSLSKKGLIQEIKIDKKRSFEAKSLAELLDYFRKKEKDLLEISKEFGQDKEMEKVESSLLENELKSPDLILIYGLSEKADDFLSKFSNMNNIKIIISSKNIKIPAENFKNTEIKWLPSKYPSPFTTIISERGVFLVYNGGSIVELKNPDIISMHRSYFDILWKDASKID